MIFNFYFSAWLNFEGLAEIGSWIVETYFSSFVFAKITITEEKISDRFQFGFSFRNISEISSEIYNSFPNMMLMTSACSNDFNFNLSRN